MNLKKWKGVAVFIEHDEGTVESVSWELLGKGKELADKTKEQLFAIILGSNVDHIANEAIERGANEVYYANNDLLTHYRWETYTKVTEEIINKIMPNAMIFAATPNGRDLAGRLAVRVKTGLTADVVQLDMNDDKLLLGSVPGFGGSILAVIKCEHTRPQMATVRPGIFDALPPNPKNKGKINKFPVNLKPEDISTEIIKKIKIDQEDISKAKKLVAAGRGIGTNFETVQEITKLLDASLGLTRPLCDVGLMPRNHQVGSTGVTVKADKTLVLGASGAMHFTSGIQDSETVIAVNLDDTAPIFEYADYIVKADLNELIPALKEALEKKVLQMKEA